MSNKEKHREWIQFPLRQRLKHLCMRLATAGGTIRGTVQQIAGQSCASKEKSTIIPALSKNADAHFTKVC